jgi:hypothetical protein
MPRLGWGRLAELLVIAAVLWTARYWHFRGYGLYEDDYTRVSVALGMTAPQALSAASQSLSFAYEHGKALHSPAIYLLAFVGSRLAGLASLYGLGYLILLVNAVLFFLLLLRLTNPFLAFVGGLAFGLSPSDTTQALLTHSFGLQPSLLLLLLALHAYLSRKRLLAYVLAAGILLVYETPFTLFAVAPLLTEAWDRRLARRLAAHLAVLGVLLATAVGIRILIGEARVSGLDLGGALLTPILHMAEGPIVSLGTFLYRPVQALLSLDWEIAIALGAGFLFFFGLLLAKSRGLAPAPARAILGSLRGGKGPRNLPEETRDVLRLALIGLLMLVLAYPLTFTVRAYAISGRDTRVHFAAVLGASILWGAFAWLLLALTQSARKRWLGVGFLAIVFAGLLGFGFVVQRDYVRSWELQRSFWSQLVRLCPDLEDGAVILVDPDAFDDTRQIAANHWNLPRVLEQIYRFPEAWADPPRVYRLVPGWQEHILTGTGNLRLDPTTVLAPPSLYGEVRADHVIYLTGAGGRLEREAGPLLIGGQEVGLKPPAPGALAGFPPGTLFPYLIEGTRARLPDEARAEAQR